jgi:hypothetical protein
VALKVDTERYVPTDGNYYEASDVYIVILIIRLSLETGLVI